MTPRDPMIDELCRILDVRHPDSDQFEPAFRRAVWAVMGEAISLKKDDDGADNTMTLYKGTGLAAIVSERWRHIDEEVYDVYHDDTYTGDELALAAATYAIPARVRFTSQDGSNMPRLWPWPDGFKATPADRIRELAKAGALIAAEIDRILRAKNKAEKT